MLAAESWTVEAIREEVKRVVEAEEKQYGNGPQDKENGRSFCPDEAEAGAASGPDEAVKDGRFIQFDSAFVLRCLSKNQVGDAEIFQAIHRDMLIYDHAAGAWFKWAGHYFKLDKTEGYITKIQAICQIYELELQRTSGGSKMGNVFQMHNRKKSTVDSELQLS